MVCEHVQYESHNFNKHAKFTIIDQLTITSKSKETLTQRLTERKSVWICYIRKILTWDLVNNKHNNYIKRLLSCIRLPNIRLSQLQLGHYQTEKLSS